MAPTSFTYDFSDALLGFKGKSTFSTGLFIDGKFVDSVQTGQTTDLVNPVNGKHLCSVTIGCEKDVDIAVECAQRAFDDSWGLKTSGQQRGRLLLRLATLMNENIDELVALETLNSGKTYNRAYGDVVGAASVIRYYGGWGDKIHGKTIEVDDSIFAYTRMEPFGVVGQIVPWNFPIVMMSWKLGPALATGNTIVFKPSEWTPLTALRVAALIVEAGFPPGVVNIVNGYGSAVGAAISSHMGIEKVAFTGSTLVGRRIVKAAAESNLKKVTVELGGKSPTLILDDCDLEAAAKWAAFGIIFNHGQTCCAGSRVLVQENVYDKFMENFTTAMKAVKVGDPLHPETTQGPQVSEVHFKRVMNYIDLGKKEGATCYLGGERHGAEGFFIQPTIFTDVTSEMTIMKEEIFGPVIVVSKFRDDEELVKLANDTLYGLAAGIFSQNISRAIGLASKIRAGTVWINMYNVLHPNVPFGGYKQSGFGRELGEYALENYTQVKAVLANLTGPAPF